MKTIKDYQECFKLYDVEMKSFRQFISDPNQKEFYPIKRVIVKNDDGSLSMQMGWFDADSIDRESLTF